MVLYSKIKTESSNNWGLCVHCTLYIYKPYMKLKIISLNFIIIFVCITMRDTALPLRRNLFWRWRFLNFFFLNFFLWRLFDFSCLLAEKINSEDCKGNAATAREDESRRQSYDETWNKNCWSTQNIILGNYCHDLPLSCQWITVDSLSFVWKKKKKEENLISYQVDEGHRWKMSQDSLSSWLYRGQDTEYWAGVGRGGQWSQQKRFFLT